MKISQPETILDPYEWLPGYGESRVSFRALGEDVVIDVFYDKEVILEGEEISIYLRREIIFRSVKFFIKEPFPAGGVFKFDGDPTGYELGKLTEFKCSDLLQSNLNVWRSISSHQRPRLKHFNIQFFSENISFHVLAANLFLSDEISAS